MIKIFLTLLPNPSLMLLLPFQYVFICLYQLFILKNKLSIHPNKNNNVHYFLPKVRFIFCKVY